MPATVLSRDGTRIAVERADATDELYRHHLNLPRSRASIKSLILRIKSV